MIASSDSEACDSGGSAAVLPLEFLSAAVSARAGVVAARVCRRASWLLRSSISANEIIRAGRDAGDSRTKWEAVGLQRGAEELDDDAELTLLAGPGAAVARWPPMVGGGGGALSGRGWLWMWSASSFVGGADGCMLFTSV